MPFCVWKIQFLILYVQCSMKKANRGHRNKERKKYTKQISTAFIEDVKLEIM